MNILQLLRDIFNHRTVPMPPPTATTCGVAVIVRALDGTGVIPNASVTVGAQSGTTNRDGYVFVGNVPRAVPVLVSVTAEGYVSYVDQPYVFLADNQDVPVALENARLLPPMPLEALAQIRGAMWTARLDVPWGPRPNQSDNCICIDYFECFSPSDQDRIVQAYHGDRGYTHAPMGPIVDAGYHGQLPSCDWRVNPDVYLDAALKLERAGVRVIHFLRPDRDCAGLPWTVADLERELGPIFASPKAQEVMRIVCLGWEPGPRYYYDNAWWVEMCQWMARTFPHALRLIHMVSDCDAPTGQDDDKKGLTNGQCWANVAPYIHGFLAQYGGYVDGQTVQQFIPNLQAAVVDLTRRFGDPSYGPGADWPKSSAWGEGKPIRVYAGEYAAYRSYWGNAPESESVAIGAAALEAGAAGYFDGGPKA